MPVIDAHCHASLYWYEPVEVPSPQMDLNGVDQAVLIQIIGWFDNSHSLWTFGG